MCVCVVCDAVEIVDVIVAVTVIVVGVVAAVVVDGWGVGVGVGIGFDVALAAGGVGHRVLFNQLMFTTHLVLVHSACWQLFAADQLLKVVTLSAESCVAAIAAVAVVNGVIAVAVDAVTGTVPYC